MNNFFSMAWKYIDLIMISVGVILSVVKKQSAVNRSAARAREGKAARRGKVVNPDTGRWEDPVEEVVVEQESTDD